MFFETQVDMCTPPSHVRFYNKLKDAEVERSIRLPIPIQLLVNNHNYMKLSVLIEPRRIQQCQTYYLAMHDPALCYKLTTLHAAVAW